MWYFSWLLGLGFACAFAILNAIWLEIVEDEMAPVDNNPGSGGDRTRDNGDGAPSPTIASSASTVRGSDSAGATTGVDPL